MASAQEREAKPVWSSVPLSVRRETERLLGAEVTRAVRAFGGYSPSATFRLFLSDGQRRFFKATYPLRTGSAVKWNLEQEEAVYVKLIDFITPWAPRYFGSVRADGWHAVLLEDVGGSAVLPWTTETARVATVSYAEFHASTHGVTLPSWLPRGRYGEFGVYWRQLAAEPQGLAQVANLAGGEHHEALDWLARNVATLAEAEVRLEKAAEPFVLMHFDTRSDNVRLQGRLLRIFDWPFASFGPHEFELAAFAQSIESEGGPSCEQLATWYSEVLPVREDVLQTAIVGIAGYFADRAPRPPLSELPRLRLVQRVGLKASLNWAARCLSLDQPTWLNAVSS